MVLRLRSISLARLLFVVVLGVVSSFVLVSFVARSRARRVDAAINAIVGDAIPAVRRVSVARSALRELDEDVTHLASGTDPGARARIVADHALVDQALSEYAALSGADPAQRDEAAARHTALDATLATLLTPVEGGSLRDALADEHERSEKLDEVLERLVDVEAARAARLGGEAQARRRETRSIVTLLDSCTVILALVAAGLAAVSLRRSMGALEDANLAAEVRMTHLEMRSSELDQFAGRVAHDVLGPLSASVLALQVAQRRYPEDESLQSLVKRGLSGIGRCTTLVEGLLEFARAGAKADRGATCALSAVLADVIQGVQGDAAEAHVVVRADAMEPCVLGCGEGVLTSMLSNLVRNAVKHMGEATVREVHARVSGAGPSACRIVIEDTGPGVPAGLERAIFEPFVRGGVKTPGVGLGLATVRKLALAYGGDVGYAPRPGGGSAFWLELPVVTAPRRELESANEPAHA